MPALNEQQQKVRELRDFVSQMFSLTEIQLFCYDMGLEYENLAGSTKSEKILSLVQYAERHSHFVELWNKVADLRPLSWRKYDGAAVVVPETRQPETKQEPDDLAMAIELIGQSQTALNQAMFHLARVKVNRG